MGVQTSSDSTMTDELNKCKAREGEGRRGKCVWTGQNTAHLRGNEDSLSQFVAADLGHLNCLG